MSFDLDKAAEMLVRNEYEDPSLSVFNSSNYHNEMPGGAVSFPEASLDERLARHPPQPHTSPMQQQPLQHFDPSGAHAHPGGHTHGGPRTRGAPAGYPMMQQQPPNMLQQQQQQGREGQQHYHQQQRLTRAGSMRDPDPFFTVSASTSAMSSSQGMPPQAMSMPPVTRMATRGSPGGAATSGNGGGQALQRQSSGVGAVVQSITRLPELPTPEIIDRMLQSHPSCGRVGGPSFEDIRDFYNQTPKNDIAWCCLRIMGAHLQLDPKEKPRVEKIVRLAEEYKSGLKSLKDDRAGAEQIKKLQEMTIKLLKGILGAEWFERIQVAYTGYFLRLVLVEMDKSQRQKGSNAHLKCIALYANLGAALKKASQPMHYKIQSQGLRALQTLVGHQTCEYLWRRVIFLFLFLKEKDMKRKKEASTRSNSLQQGGGVMQSMPLMQQQQMYAAGQMYPAYGQQMQQQDPSSLASGAKGATASWTKGGAKGGRKRKVSDSGVNQAGDSPTGADASSSAKKPKRTNSKKAAGTSAGKGGPAKTEAEKERDRLEKEREKVAAAATAAQEKERLAQEKEKEKAEKAAERERERAEKERIRLADKEKARLERERLRAERAAEKAAEKERARVERERKLKEAREEREREKQEAAKERERLRIEAAKERERVKTEAAKERAEKAALVSGKSTGTGRSGGGGGGSRKGGGASASAANDFWDKDLPAIDAIDKVIQSDDSIFTKTMKKKIFVQAMKRYGLDLDPNTFETLSEAVELHLVSLLGKATDIMSFRTLPFAKSANASVVPTSEPKKAISAIYKREYLEAKAKAEAEKDAIRKAGEKKGQSKKDMDEEIKEKVEKLRQEEDNKRLAREANEATMSVLGGGDAKWAKWSKAGGTASAASTPKKGPSHSRSQSQSQLPTMNEEAIANNTSLLNFLNSDGSSEEKVKLTTEDLLLVLKRDWRYKGSKWLMQMEYEFE